MFRELDLYNKFSISAKSKGVKFSAHSTGKSKLKMAAGRVRNCMLEGFKWSHIFLSSFFIAATTCIFVLKAFSKKDVKMFWFGCLGKSLGPQKLGKILEKDQCSDDIVDISEF